MTVRANEENSCKQRILICEKFTESQDLAIKATADHSLWQGMS